MTEEPKKRQPAKKPTARKTVEKPKIVISLDDVGSSEVDAIVSQLEEAKKVPLVRNIGEPEKTGSGPRAIGWMALAGVVGGIATWLAWGLTQSLFANDDDATRSNVVATVIVAALIGMALVFGDTLRASAYSKLGKRTGIGLAAAIGLGLIFGFIASSLYVAGTERIIEDLLASGLDFSDDQLYEQFSSRNQLNRGIAWMFVGLAAGLTVSIASLEWKRMLITGGGGLVGGFLGGYLFDLISSEDFAQITGLLITGLSVGLVIALSEEAAKTSWIEITHGGMAGKQFILYKNAISLGSAGSADITLIKDVTMPAIAATLEKQGGVMIVSSLDPNSPVFLNGVETVKAQIKDGDTLSIGKTGIRYRERGQKAVNSGIVRS
jgi:hypothetical protein